MEKKTNIKLCNNTTINYYITNAMNRIYGEKQNYKYKIL
jgi:hypothetical protein